VCVCAFMFLYCSQHCMFNVYDVAALWRNKL